ncbi:MAG: hypothetical protein ACYCS7_06955 [Acidimicrobiales bacterium]
MRWIRLPGRVGLAGVLAGSVLLAGGGGLGVVALASSQSAGALSAQLPAVGVREQNVNAAGRIRVALPSTGVGVNGNVSVSNLPTNAAGRLKTQNGTGAAHLAQAWAVTEGNGLAPVTVSGSGMFKGLVLSAYQDGGGTGGCVGAQVYVDGTQMLGDSINGASMFGSTSPAEGATTLPSSGSWSMYFTPPGGLPFHHSLTVTLSPYGSCGAAAPMAYRIWYTTSS